MGRKLCQYCRRFYDKHGIGRHKQNCKKKKIWDDKLSHEGIITEPKKGLIHISGGMKIYLMLGRGNKTEEDKIFKNNLDRVEKDYGIQLSYNSDTDELIVKEDHQGEGMKPKDQLIRELEKLKEKRCVCTEETKHTMFSIMAFSNDKIDQAISTIKEFLKGYNLVKVEDLLDKEEIRILEAHLMEGAEEYIPSILRKLKKNIKEKGK